MVEASSTMTQIFKICSMILVKRRFLDVVKEDMGEVGAKEMDVKDKKMWRMMIRCGHP